MKKTKYVSYKKCWVKCCGNKSSGKTVSDGISYFSLPRDIAKRNAWIENCVPELANNNKIIKNIRICQDHFEDRMFLNVKKKNRLISIAIPTRFNDNRLAIRMCGNESPSNISEPLACPIPIHDSSTPSCEPPLQLSHQTPRIMELRKDLGQAKE